MIEEIDFQDSGNQVLVTIDNETQSLPIKIIKKLSTYIDLNKSLNTALGNNIEVDASICYVKKSEDDENDPSLSHDGTVTISIYNGEEIYYVKDVRFKKGHIIDSIKNTLPLGSYTMTIQYSGNKYFEESSLTIEFNIEKRLATCELTRKKYSGDFLEKINISGALKDNERKTSIKNCSFFYDFDGKTYSANTDVNGNFIFDVTIPAPDISHCNIPYELVDESDFEPGDLYEEDAEEEFIDEDGNIRLYSDIEEDTETNNIEEEPVYEYPDDPDIEEYYPNASYIVKLYTDNESYYFNEEVEVIANKAPTHVIIDSINPNDHTNTLTVAGAGLATYNSRDNDIKYGKISIELPELNYKHSNNVNIKNGLFIADINLTNVYGVYNKSDIETLEPYDTTSITYTNIQVSGDTEINKGDTLEVKATVSSTELSGYVKYGILIFYLYDNDDNMIYHYATEIDKTGVGIFNFNTSKSGKYSVQVEYVGMFNYQSSLMNDKYQITVK